MKTNLTTILDALKEANIAIKRPSAQKNATLFVNPASNAVEFNGFSSLLDYRVFLSSLYVKCKLDIDGQLNERALIEALELMQELSLLLFEVKEFKRQYFPKKPHSGLLERVIIQKNHTTRVVISDEHIVIVEAYMNEQLLILIQLKKLFKNRIAHLEKFYGGGSPLHTSKGRSRGNKKQLALFPEGSFNTMICWTEGKVEFVELVEAIHKSGAVGLLKGGKLTREDFFELFQWLFNIHVENYGAILKSAKGRKVEKARYLLKLVEVFRGDHLLFILLLIITIYTSY